MYYLKRIIIFFVINITLSAYAINFNNVRLSNQIQISVLNTENGLPQNDIYSIVQDENGFMWFASNDGLIRYDGFDFKNFSIQDNSILTNLPVSLCDDKRGNLLIGTADKGVFIFNYKTEKFRRIYNHKIKAPNHLIVDRYNTIWIIDEDQQLISIKLNKEIIEMKIYSFKVDGFTLNDKNEMVACSGNRLLMADINCEFKILRLKGFSSIENLLYRNREKYFISHQKLFKLSHNNKLSQICDINVGNYGFTKNGNLIVSNSDGIFLFIKFGDKYIHSQLLKSGNIGVNCFFEDSYGTLWIGTFRNGIFKIDAYKRLFSNYDFPANVETVFQDSKKKIWFGNAEGKLFCFKDKSFTTHESIFLPIEPKPYMITSVAENKYDDMIYVSCFNGVMFSSAKNSSYNFKYHINLGTKQVGYVQDMLFDSNRLWIASYNKGLFCYDLSKKEIITHLYCDCKKTLPTNTMRSLKKDSKGNLWVGSDDGLIIISKSELYRKNPKVKLITSGEDPKKNICNNYVLPLLESKDGSMWVGTLNGLNHLQNIDNNFNFINTVYSTDGGLSNNQIRTIIEDNSQNIWISTSRGINCITKNGKRIYSYSLEDGLQDYEFRDLAGTKLDNSYLIFGGIRGFNIFNPNNIDCKEKCPEVILVDFQVFNKSISIKDKINGNAILNKPIAFAKEINLPYYDSSISIFFSSINSGARNKQVYRYILKNFDKDWILTNSKDRIAKYTNLPYGEYEFIVEASNDGFLWSKSKKIKIIIEKPFWLQ